MAGAERSQFHVAAEADCGPGQGGSRRQIAAAARLLRSIRPADGELEIALHEIARRLERMAETGKPCRPHGGTFRRVLDSLSA
jgi:hypothetical protein